MMKEESDHGNLSKKILKQSEKAMRKQIIDKKWRKLFGNTIWKIMDKLNNLLDGITRLKPGSETQSPVIEYRPEEGDYW